MFFCFSLLAKERTCECEIRQERERKKKRSKVLFPSFLHFRFFFFPQKKPQTPSSHTDAPSASSLRAASSSSAASESPGATASAEW